MDNRADRRYPPESRSTSLATPIAIVIAGALITLGIVLAILLRGNPEETGGGGLSSSPTQAAALGSAHPSDEHASVSPLPSGSGASGALTNPDPFHRNFPFTKQECGHQFLEDVAGLPEQFPTVEQLWYAADESGGQTHSCTWTIAPQTRVYLSFHKFTTRDDMERAFQASFGRFAGGSIDCETDVTAGYGEYNFGSREGMAACNRGAAVHVLAWTEVNTNVISAVWATRLDQHTADEIGTWWKNPVSGPVCRETAESEELIEIHLCEDDSTSS